MSFIDADYADELRREGRAARQHMNELLAHPHCADPEHPGCINCRDAYEETDALAHLGEIFEPTF